MESITPVTAELLLDLLEQRKLEEIRRELELIQPADLADILESVKDDEARLELFGLMDDERRSDVLLAMEQDQVDEMIDDMPASEVAAIVEEMAPDDAADFLGELEDDRASEVLKEMEDSDRREITQLLSFDEETAGGMMTSELCAFPANMKVGNVLKALGRADLKDPVTYVYVLDPKSREFLGTAPLVRLISVEATTPLETITDRDHVWATVDMDSEEVARMFRRYNLWVMPVLDAQHRLVGRITADDVLDVSIREASEDIAQMTGTPDLVEEDEVSIFRTIRMRLPWLLVTLGLGMTNCFVIQGMLRDIGLPLEAILAISILASFPPVIMAMSGNSGMQAATIFIREMALEKILPSQYARLVARESFTGIGMGLTCGLLAGTTTWLWLHFSQINVAPLSDSSLALIIGFSMLSAMTTACVMGTIIPICLKKLGIDPALAAGPFVTTLNDIFSSVIYFLIARTTIEFMLQQA
ncbi:MAG: hypothetical protein RL095_3306 [Verrucomicrobiota bacterium]|jgi:magnesium transporter